jgi:hypothetical protein
MNKLRSIFKESFYGSELTKNAVIEFTYPQLKQIDIDATISKLKELLSQLEVQFVSHYNNISKVIVVCPSSKADEVKKVATSVGLTVQNELRPDDNETSKI